MKKRKKSKLSLMLIALILVLSVGYALLTQQLKIDGISIINKATWKIYWDNVDVNENSVSGDAVTSAAEITNTEKTLVEYSITLSKPGDFYEFTVDAVNEGTIDAMINVVSNKIYESNGTTEKELPEYLTYSVTYKNGKPIAKNHLLAANSTETYKVRVEFADVTADKLPSEEEILKFKFSVDYIQADENATVSHLIPALVYRYGTNYVSIGDSLPVTGTKWIIKENGEENEMLARYVYDTHAECTAFLTENGITEGVAMTFEEATYTYTCAEKTGTFGGIGDYTEDYTTLNKTYFLKHNISNEGAVDSSEVCYILNDQLYCLIPGIDNYSSNQNILSNSFGDDSCLTKNGKTTCINGNMYSTIYEYGSAVVYDNDMYCLVDKNSSNCGDNSNYSNYEPIHTVNVIVNNGIIDDDSSKIVDNNSSESFNLIPSVGYPIGTVSCTNNQNGVLVNNVLYVNNVSDNTICTVTYTFQTATVLYTDGTLIINEQSNQRLSNISIHGAVKNEYEAMSNSNAYVFNSYFAQPWDSQKTSVTRVEIGQKIEPIYTKYWFFGLTNMTEGDLANLDTSQVIDMSNMFCETGENATTWSIGDLSNWDTSKVTNMSFMFSNAGNSATTFDIGDLSNWDTSKVTNMRGMFSNVYSGSASTTWSVGDLSDWDTSSVTDMSNMFHHAGDNAEVFNIGNLSSWNTSQVTNMEYMFQGAGQNSTTWSIGDLSNWDTSKVTKMREMFQAAGIRATTWNIGDLSNWDTSKVTDMTAMFEYAGQSATTWNIGDLSNWDTSKVTNMEYMFMCAGQNATTWNSIGTLNVYATNIYRMFYLSPKAKATLNIYSNPPRTNSNSGCDYAFYGAATASDALITVNYSSSTTNINAIIGTKSADSNVVKGSQLD